MGGTREQKHAETTLKHTEHTHTNNYRTKQQQNKSTQEAHKNTREAHVIHTDSHSGTTLVREGEARTDGRTDAWTEEHKLCENRAAIGGTPRPDSHADTHTASHRTHERNETISRLVYIYIYIKIQINSAEASLFCSTPIRASAMEPSTSKLLPHSLRPRTSASPFNRCSASLASLHCAAA
jgi:hypothetical protein